MKNNLSFQNIFKRETKLASYIIICLTLVVISLSYAMFLKVESNSTNQEIVAGDFTFTYQEGTQITSTAKSSCFLPMTQDEAGLVASDCDYQFSVQNTRTLKASYTLKLTAETDNTMDPAKLKVIMKKQVGDTLQIINGYPATISSLSDGVLLTDDIEPNAIVVYTVQIYVDETTFVDSDISKVVSYKINGTGIVHEDQDISTRNIGNEIISQLDTTGSCPTVNEDGSVTVTGVEDTKALVCSAKDDYGTSYYYRGTSTNNYVKFGGFYWRILRVNGDGSIRMIYAGDVNVIDALDESTRQTVLANGYDDSTTKYTQIGESSFNANRESNAYVGYMYGNPDGTTYEEVHVNTNDSTIKTYLDNWYKQNVLDKGLSSYIADSGFCNDRSLASTANYPDNGDGVQNDRRGVATNYAGYERYSKTHQPTLICLNASNDLFTTNTATKGNKALTYPIGLINIDELMLAGVYESNSNFYLYTGTVYWTLSPVWFNNIDTAANEFVLGHGGNASSGYYANSLLGVRPVINLNSHALKNGTGVWNDPYTI